MTRPAVLSSPSKIRPDDFDDFSICKLRPCCSLCYRQAISDRFIARPRICNHIITYVRSAKQASKQCNGFRTIVQVEAWSRLQSVQGFQCRRQRSSIVFRSQSHAVTVIQPNLVTTRRDAKRTLTRIIKEWVQETIRLLDAGMHDATTGAHEPT